MKIIVGLGNPGEKFKNTRHNAGFMAVDALAASLGLAWEKSEKHKAEVAGAGATNLRIIKPQTFMNDSGRPVLSFMTFYKLLPKFAGLRKKDSDLSGMLTVIHDDIDIDLGKYKISIDSRSAGHNGVQSIIDSLKTKNFKRIRIGVKTEALKTIPADKFVLQRFGDEELKIIKKIIEEVIGKIIRK